jgi:hypothetical protein
MGEQHTQTDYACRTRPAVVNGRGVQVTEPRLVGIVCRRRTGWVCFFVSAAKSYDPAGALAATVMNSIRS